MGPDLEGVMYDDFPIFKVKAYALEMGLRSQSSIFNPQQKKIVENSLPFDDGSD